jgi:FSR family fosmidomycin resistance protein-like MFS transporter
LADEAVGTGLASAASDAARARRAIAVAGGAHVAHDGFSDLLYVFFPIWQAAFGLDYGAVGVLKACYSGALASLQMPASRLAERLGHGGVLAAGTALVGLGFFAAAEAGSFAALLVALGVMGAGASTQHPLASDIVARMVPAARRRQALGLYNTAGDVGKVLFPALAALLLALSSPSLALEAFAGLGVGIAALIFAALPAVASAPQPAPAETANPAAAAALLRRPGFAALVGVGILDSAGRSGFLTFYPLVLAGKGASVPTIGIALTLVFVGGAVGKFICGPLGARFGVLWTVAATEGATALGAIAAPFAPLWLGLALAPLIGVALNGTSTVLYGTVPELVPEAARTRAFGLFYTLTIGSSALTPILLGLAGDLLSLPAAMTLLAATVLAAPMLALRLRGPLRSLASDDDARLRP